MEKDSNIRYTEFEKRIIRGSKNLYKGRLSSLHEEARNFSTKWYTLSPWFIGWLVAFLLLSLWSYLWEPTTSDVMFLGSWFFFSIHYLLGVMITQFKVKRRGILILAILTLSLSFALLFSRIYLTITRFAPLSQVIYITVSMMLILPFYAGGVYSLIKEFGEER